MAYLVVSIKGKEICRRELSGPMTLGRSTECDLWLNDAGVSRHHCRFEREARGGADAWRVVDLGSRNGVVVHGERVAQHTLADGEAIHVGSARVTFHAVGYVSSRPSQPSTPQGGDSVSDTIIAANSASRMSRALPTPRVPAPENDGESAPKPAAPLAFTRPPARPIPAATGSVDETGNGRRKKTNAEHPPHRESLLRRFLHKT